jgi:Rieske Fe-S protein
VGGGTIFADKKVVVTQPVAGTFKGFSTTCTHLGCQVNKVADGLIQCPCHGSRYSVTDGSVKAGPAPKPLPAQNITVSGTQINLA